MNNFMKSLRNFIKRKSRSLKYGSNSIILIAVVLAIAVFTNLIVGMLDIEWDLTPNKVFTIGETTKNILKEIDKDVTIYALYDEGKVESDEELMKIAKLLDQYEDYGVEVKFVDPDRDPTIINKIKGDNLLKDISKGDFVAKCGDKIRVIDYNELFEYEYDFYYRYVAGLKAEQVFTGAIKYVTSDNTPVIYFTEGHGERSLTSYFSALKEILERNNYEVKTVNLATAAKVPEDTSILVIAGPQSDLTLSEKEKIREYLENGGANAVFLFDPLNIDEKFEMFNDLLMDFNITLNYDKVKEGDSNYHMPNDPYSLAATAKVSYFVSGLSDGMIFMPSSRSINILKNEKTGVTVTPIITTTSKAVGVNIADGSEREGPLTLAAAVEYTGMADARVDTTKILVMGNSQFTSDSVITAAGQNGLIYFWAGINWMQGQQEQIIISSKAYETRTMDISQAQANFLAIFVTVVLPLLILGTGMVVWLRRRHL